MSHTWSETFSETLFFFKRFFSNPQTLGALTPSSWALARFMARTALKEHSHDGYVLELGAGTGRFTQALIDEGLAPEKLISMELDEQLADYLKKRFSQSTIICGNACFLEAILPVEKQKNIDVVVSGLPMLNFPKTVQSQIIKGCLSVLKPGGGIVQFTYSPFSSIKCESFGLAKKRMGRVWRNVPPATVWRYEGKDFEQTSQS